jgi:flagellar protein FlaG
VADVAFTPITANYEPNVQYIEPKPAERAEPAKPPEAANISDAKPKMALPSEAELNRTMDTINEKLSMANRRLSISIHEKTKLKIVKVIDTTNDEIIRVIPPEKTLDFYAGMLEMAGLLFDKSK